MNKTFKGAAKRLEDKDIPRIGARIGVGEDELHAFMEVEAAGSGFDSKKRPKMLFEPHVFYRNLKGAERDAAVKAGLAYAKWKRNYPADSYPRLLKAMEINETAALKAASWGLGQILGENYKAAGYDSPQDMVADFMEDEETHLNAMVSFLIVKKIAADLKAHRWADVARKYNGAGYKANSYDTRMAAAYAKWRKIKDTPWEAQPGEEVLTPKPKPTPAEPERKVYVDTTTVENVQKKLKALGYTEVGGIDGKLGTLTVAAILAFRNENGLPLVPEIDDEMLVALGTAKPREIGQARAEAAPATVAAKVPEVKTNAWLKIGGFFTAIGTTLAASIDGILGNLGTASAYIQPLKDAAGDVPGWVWFLAIAIAAAAIFFVARHGEQKGVEAFQNGQRR